MAKLNVEFFDKIAAKVIKEGEPDDLAKFMLSGSEHIAAVQRHFNNLEADEKKELTLKGDEWFLGYGNAKKHTGLPLFKCLTSSIIPHVEDLRISYTHLKDYSFLNDIKNLYSLNLQFADDEHIKVLAALSSLRTVHYLSLNFKGLNLQFLSSLPFSFNCLNAHNFIFEADPKRDKVFRATYVHLSGNEKLKNDFVFDRQNYENYAAVFPNAKNINFYFYIKLVDDISDLLKVSNANHAHEVELREIFCAYHFFDYSGYPNSKVLKMLQGDERWETEACPYKLAFLYNNGRAAYCVFPLAIAEVGNILAERSLRRIPEDSSGNPEDYYRLTLENEWRHKAEFEVLKTAPVASLLQAYGEITGMDHERLRFRLGSRWVSDGTVADNFQDGDVLFIRFA